MIFQLRCHFTKKSLKKIYEKFNLSQRRCLHRKSNKTLLKKWKRLTFRLDSILSHTLPFNVRLFLLHLSLPLPLSLDIIAKPYDDNQHQLVHIRGICDEKKFYEKEKVKRTLKIIHQKLGHSFHGDRMSKPFSVLPAVNMWWPCKQTNKIKEKKT